MTQSKVGDKLQIVEVILPLRVSEEDEKKE